MKKRFQIIPAVYLVIRDGEKVLLARRFNTGYEDGKFSLPAGHLDGDEPMTVALSREAKEELDINVDPKDLNLVHVMHHRSEIVDSTDDERVDFYFTVNKYDGEPTIAEPDKCDALEWHSIHKLPKNMVRRVKLSLEGISKNDFLTEVGWDA